MAWVLILILAGSGSHGVSVTTTDFTDKASCEAAGRAAKELGSLLLSVRYTCVQR